MKAFPSLRTERDGSHGGGGGPGWKGMDPKSDPASGGGMGGIRAADAEGDALRKSGPVPDDPMHPAVSAVSRATAAAGMARATRGDPSTMRGA